MYSLLCSSNANKLSRWIFQCNYQNAIMCTKLSWIQSHYLFAVWGLLRRFCKVSKSETTTTRWDPSQSPNMSPNFWRSLWKPLNISLPKMYPSPIIGNGRLGPGGKWLGCWKVLKYHSGIKTSRNMKNRSSISNHSQVKPEFELCLCVH